MHRVSHGGRPIGRVAFGDAGPLRALVAPVRGQHLIDASPDTLEVVLLVRVVLRRVDAATTHDVGPDRARVQVRQCSNDLFGCEGPSASLAAETLGRAENLVVDGYGPLVKL